MYFICMHILHLCIIVEKRLKIFTLKKFIRVMQMSESLWRKKNIRFSPFLFLWTSDLFLTTKLWRIIFLVQIGITTVGFSKPWTESLQETTRSKVGKHYTFFWSKMIIRQWVLVSFNSLSLLRKQRRLRVFHTTKLWSIILFFFWGGGPKW